MNDPIDVRSTDPDQSRLRLRNFRQGWRHAVDGREYRDALQQLTWQNLGWRLGSIFGETPDDLIEAQYRWCVAQQSMGGLDPGDI